METLCSSWNGLSTVWKVSKYGTFSDLYFPYSVRIQEYGQEKTPYLDTFHPVYF